MTVTHELPQQISFAKGHGTENDFVIIEDLDAKLPLTPQLISAMCDRRAGVGADGVLRVARVGALLASGVLTQAPEGLDPSDYFMDYYNADGSAAEMCGNGTRVFAHWLRSRALVDADDFSIGTRAGVRTVSVHSFSATDADVSVDMGSAEVTGVSTCHIGTASYAGMGVDMGNPHLACVVPGLTPQALSEIDLVQPVVDSEFFPEGVNVELLTELDHQSQIHMRVYERGVGETRSCGTGTVAAARSALADAGLVDGHVVVHIPGGSVSVTIQGDTSVLRGPSKIVAWGQLDTRGLNA